MLMQRTLGRIGDDVQPNSEEISAIRFVTAEALDRELAENPERFTPWFQQEWRELNDKYSAKLAKYCDLD